MTSPIRTRVQAWLLRQGWGLAVGIVLTLLAVVIYAANTTQLFEWLAFDVHVRRFSDIPASDKILHIDIDDDALARVESWPWPRDLQAELIRILRELRAEQIVLDIVWSEPKPPELRLPDLGRFSDLDNQIKRIGELSGENLVYPDDELAAAISEAGNVHLAMYYESALAQGPRSNQDADIARLLGENFELTADDIAQRLNLPREQIERNFASLKREAAEVGVDRFLEVHPQATFDEVHRAMLSTPLERMTADRADVLAAYHRVLGLRTLRAKCSPLPDGLKGRLPRVSRVIPPIYKLTAEGRAVGFVTFQPDADGRTRHVPLLMDWDGLLLEHLAFSAARDALSIEIGDLSMDAEGYLVIASRGDRPAMRIQLDERGQMLIDWHVEREGWPKCFEHRPVTLLLQLSDCRKRMRENDVLREWKLDEAVSLIKEEAGFAAYRDRVNRMLELQRQARWARQAGRGADPSVAADEAEAQRLRGLVERDRQDVISLVREEWAELKKQPVPQDDAAAAEYHRFERADRLIEQESAELENVNRQIDTEYRRLFDQLRPMVEGRIAVVGYTATAVADMVNTPPYERVPGVIVHTNVLNNFLQGQFRTWASRTVGIVCILVAGLLTTLVTSLRGPRFTLVLLGLMIAVSFTVNARIVFQRWEHWVQPLTVVAAALVIWAAIVLVHYLTTERERRRFSRAVAQYVSPAMARQIAQNTDNLDFSPVATRVTCFFTDLANFTPMSERLGPEGTKTVLNPYLEAMSAVLHRHQAMINKFMGDGIFAFFNPPILACPRHEAAACAAALDCQHELIELRRRWKDHPLGGEFDRLAMRIGIASGTVFVGDYGSETKLDYTCMGDTVNLAARLESANKFFGTHIMVTGPTQQAAGDDYLYRPLGALQVRGQSMALTVYELLGRRGEVDDESLRYAEVFGEAVAAFVLRNWPAAQSAFAACLALRPSDPGPALYLQAVQEYLHVPPPEDWSGSLELKQK